MIVNQAQEEYTERRDCSSADSAQPGMRKSGYTRTLRVLVTVLLLSVSAFLFTACGKKQAKIEPLHVEGTKLVNSKGEPVQLYGISTHGLQWFPQYVNQEAFHELHEKWNVSLIRLAMYTDEGGYCDGGDQEALKQVIDDGVTYATEEGMYVIIDWHILRDGDPRQNMDEAVKFFDEMSKKYADHVNIFYEICNEPNGTYGMPAQINEYANTVIPVIRANDPDSIIIVGSPSYSRLPYAAIYNPLDYENIFYTMHFYAYNAGDDSRKDMVRALENGVPVFVSEYGITQGNGDGELGYESGEKWLDLIDEYQLSCCIWQLSNKDESCSLLKPECEKTSGFTWDDLSDHGKWVFRRYTGKDRLE